MPFFPQAHLSPEAGFFQILSELDQASSTPQKQAHCGPHQCRPRHEEAFTPRFDITETPSDYQLFGELPGVAQEDLIIEFSDAQTIVIKGKTSRDGTSIATAVVEEPTVEAEKDTSDASSEKSHNATVEDGYDEADTPLAAPATTATAVSTPEKPVQKKAEAPKPKFWVSERKVGSFARSFSFSQRIEHHGVQATLKNGVLHVTVPKVTKTEKIIISVA
ncbi:putative 30 kDa heat shock protein [Amylocarpus encephaloides]|uniref:30 kDa heat shock protein n=1 Tax=Amylocarpus encephaloides TaxID=45428 RepID=A0A9P8C2V1_9HELO|nr:putative 30 kDa heat shock protein [Amylocarpus encephaloides]